MRGSSVWPSWAVRSHLWARHCLSWHPLASVPRSRYLRESHRKFNFLFFLFPSPLGAVNVWLSLQAHTSHSAEEWGTEISLLRCDRFESLAGALARLFFFLLLRPLFPSKFFKTPLFSQVGLFLTSYGCAYSLKYYLFFPIDYQKQNTLPFSALISCFNSCFSVTASILVLSGESFKFFNKVNALNFIPWGKFLVPL